MPQRGRIPALQRLPTAAALLGRTGHHDLHLLERDQHPQMGWMAGLPTALAARGLWGRTPLHAWPIARRGPGGVLRILIDTVFERSQFGLERRNALLVPLNQYLQRGLDIRRDPVPELFGQRQLSLAHAASHIPVPIFPQVRPMNAYAEEAREDGEAESRRYDLSCAVLVHTFASPGFPATLALGRGALPFSVPKGGSCNTSPSPLWPCRPSVGCSFMCGAKTF